MSCFPRRVCALVHLRHAVLRGGAQLCGPAGAVGAQAHPAGPVWLERDRLWRCGVLVPGRLWRRLCDLRARGGPLRRQGWRHGRGQPVDPGAHRARAGAQHGRLYLGAHSHGDRRIRPVPLHHRRHHRMVSQKGTRAGHRHLQCRFQCRGHRGAIGGACNDHPVGLADGVHPYRTADRDLAGGVADLVSQAAGL